MPVLERRRLFIAVEELDEIAHIIEAASECDVGNGIICVSKLETGHLDAIAIEVIDGRVMRDFLEEAAKVVRR